MTNSINKSIINKMVVRLNRFVATATKDSFGNPQAMKVLTFEACSSIPEDAILITTWSNWTIGTTETGRHDEWGNLFLSPTEGLFKTHSRKGDRAYGVPAWTQKTFKCVNWS